MAVYRWAGWGTCLGWMVLVGWLAAPGVVAAAEGYQASRWVADRETATFDQAAADALREVVVRVTGVSALGDNSELNAALQQPRPYIQQFRYDRESRATGGDPVSQPGHRLTIHFASKEVDLLVRRAGLPIWTGKRPELLAWIAVEQSQGRQVLAAGGEDGLSTVVLETAQQRGLPMSLPLYDLQDQMAASPGDIWGLFQQPLVVATQRYGTDNYLMGKLYNPEPGEWRFTGLWQEGAQSAWLELRATSAEEALQRAVHQLTDQLAQRYSVVLDVANASLERLMVSGVNDLQAYAQLVDYLGKLVPVRRALLRRAQAEDVEFALELESDREQLRQLLIRDRRLVEVPGGAVRPILPVIGEGAPLTQPGQFPATLPAVPEALPVLRFRWQG